MGARVLQLDIDGAIAPITNELVASAVAQAEREHDDALLIRISTPGGLMDTTREIVEQIFRSPVPVITWTGPSGARAASAGFFLLEAGDVAAMAPGTNTGASHPVLITGGEMDSIMKSKLENDAAALMRTIMEHRDRGFQASNQSAAEKTVRESASYTDQEALDQHLIDVVAADPDALLRELNGREIKRFDGRRQTLHFPAPAIEVYRPSLRERVLTAIADPNIALLLVVLGALGIYAGVSCAGDGGAGSGRRDPDAAGADGAGDVADRLAGRGTDDSGAHVLCTGGEVRNARRADNGRRGRFGTGRGDADRYERAGAANSLEHGDWTRAAVCFDHELSGLDGRAGAAE